jgi:hypothetical protein
MKAFAKNVLSDYKQRTKSVESSYEHDSRKAFFPTFYSPLSLNYMTCNGGKRRRERHGIRAIRHFEMKLWLYTSALTAMLPLSYVISLH